MRSKRVLRSGTAQEMIDFVSEWKVFLRWKSSSSISTKPCPQYKFYTKLVLDMLHMAQEFGGPAEEGFHYLRKGLYREKKFDDTLRVKKVQSLTQFFFTSMASWGFVSISYFYLGIDWHSDTLILMAFSQGLGVFLFIGIHQYWRRRYFFRTENSISVLVRASLLSKVPIPLGVFLKKSGISDYIYNPGSVQEIAIPLKEALHRFKNLGQGIENTLEDLLNESWFSHEQRQKSWLGKLEILKFLILSIFFLGSYFMAIFELFRLFLVEA